MKLKLDQLILLFVALLISSGSMQGAVVWGSEAFPDANGTKDDPGGEWTTDASALNLFDGGLFEVQTNKIEAEDLDGIAVWKTQSIDISAETAVKFSLDLDDNTNSLSADDTVWVYYSIDGGSEILLYKGVDDLPASPETIGAINLSGTSLVIIVKMFNNTIGEKYTIDNVLVEDFAAVNYYSIADGLWSDGTKWSTDDVLKHTGAAAGSFPNAQDVNVEVGAHTMTYNNTYSMANLTVLNGGTISFSVNNKMIDVFNNGTIDVQAGGAIDGTPINGSRFRYTDKGLYEVICNGTIDLGRINTNLEESQITFTGSGDITLDQHFNYNSPGTEIVNSSTGTLTVPLVRFKNINQKFTNNGTLVVDEFQHLGGLSIDGCTVTNNVGATMTVNVEVDCGNYTWNIYNYGTFEHNGQWTDVTAGEVNFYNYAGATYNFSGTTASDPDIYFYSDYATNIINYDRAGDQNVIIPQDAYSNLTISGSGSKTAATGAVDVNNDLRISGTAIFNVNTNTNDLTLAGNWINSTGIGGTFVEGNQTVTLDGTGAQEITNSVNETFYNLVLNKSAGSASIEAASDVEVTNQLTITDGIFETGTRSLFGAGNIVATGGDVRFGKTAVSVPEMSGTITCSGGIFIFNGAGDQSIDGATGAEGYHAVVFDGSGTKTLGGTIDVDSILTIDAGVVLDVSATPYNIAVEGNWNNLGTFTEQTGTVTFDGSAAVTISHSSEETFYNLTINNSVPSNAITLSSDVRVTNIMTFTAGHVVSTTSNSLKLSSGASVATVTDVSHVSGAMEKDMNLAALFEFPIGNGLVYRRGGVTPGGTANTTYRMEFIQSKHPSLDPSTLDHVSKFEHWTLERLSGTENCLVRLSYDASSVVDDQASLLVVNYDGTSDWNDECPPGCTTGGVVSDGWIESGASFAFGTSKYFTLGCDDPTKNPLVGQLFSRGTGTNNWDLTTNWSYTDGGASCGCTPQTTTKVVVRTGETINLNVAATANSIRVLNGGSLLWTSANDLQITNDGIVDVDAGGIMDRNGNTGGLQLMTAGGQYSIINDGTMDLYNLNLFNTGGAVTINGSSDINVADNIDIENANISIVNNNSGTINLDNTSGTGDLVFKSSGQWLVNNGTISIGRNLGFEDDNSLLTNNSTLTITADIAIAGTTDDNNVLTNAAGGTLSIGDDIDLNSSIFTLNNSAAVDMDGDFQNVSAGEGKFYNYAGSTWEFAGGASDVDVSLYCNYAANTFEYDGAVAQNIYVPVDAYHHLTLSTSNTKSTVNNIDVNGDISILNSAVLDVNTGDDNISLAGSWINNSGAGDPFLQGTERVTLDGTADQTITNSNGETFYNVTINKASGGVILNTGTSTDVTIATGGILTMTKGIISTTATETLAISDNAGMIGGNVTSYVSGPLQKLGDDDFTFHVGSSGVWAPVEIGDNSEGETFTVSYSASGYSDVSVTGVLNNVSTVEYWDVTDGGLVGGNDVDVTLYWKDASRSGIDNAADLVVAHFNGTDWEDFGQSAIDFGSVGWIKATGVSSFSPVATGSKAPGVNLLPVELLSFSAEHDEDENEVEVSWCTASEINNDFFVVEKSQNGIDFHEVTTVNGAGQSSSKNSYAVEDQEVYVGKTYYRLKQVDLNGDFEYSNIVFVQNRNKIKVNVFPNPLNKSPLYVAMEGGDSEEVLIILYNFLGKEVYSKVALVSTDESKVAIDVGSQLQPGIYTIVGSSKNELFRRRVVIQ